LAALNRVPVPPGWRVLTTDFYEGLALVFTGQLTREQLDASLAANIRAREGFKKKARNADHPRASHSRLNVAK
jgi:hypothetical protein